MTTEEKAKAYDEALERANKQRADYQKELDKTDKNSQLAGLLRAGISAIDMAFPQLRESEDERIRKGLIGVISDIAGGWPFEKHRIIKKEALAYLEKQKEKARNIIANLLEDGITGVQRELIEFLANNIDASWVDVIKSADTYAQRIRSIVEKQKELPFVKDVMLGYPGLYFYDGERMHFRGSPAMEEKQKEQNEESSKPEPKIPDWVFKGWDDEYMINTVIGRYSLHAEVAKKRGDTHDYNLSKSMENWLRNVVKPLILEKQKEPKDPFDDEQFNRGYEAGKHDALRGQVDAFVTEYNKGFDAGRLEGLTTGYNKAVKEMEQKEIPLMNGDADLYFDEWNQQKQNPTKRQCFEEGIRYATRLQKEQDGKELSEKIAAAYQLGLADKEEQMISEAVEGEIKDFRFIHEINYASAKIEFNSIPKLKEGDKVYIITVKEN